MDDRIDKLVQVTELLLAANAELVAVVKEQGENNAELVAVVREQSEHNAALVQAVAMLLGEETGTPLPDEGAVPERVDLDGNPY